MLCDRCRKSEANVHVIRIVNGVRYEQNLCAECAAEESRQEERAAQQAASFGFEQILGFLRHIGLVGVVMAPGAGAAAVSAGRRMPVPDLEDLGLSLPSCTGEDAANGCASVEALKAELNSAVANENFEKAAELRDTIFRMENESAGQS